MLMVVDIAAILHYRMDIKTAQVTPGVEMWVKESWSL